MEVNHIDMEDDTIDTGHLVTLVVENKHSNRYWSMSYLQGEIQRSCSVRRVEGKEEDEIQRPSSACPQYLPCRGPDVKVKVFKLELSRLDAR